MQPKKWPTFVVTCACLLASAPLWRIAAQRTAFAYEHAWVSAHFATMARAFQRSGVLALGGLPIQNNLPLTTQPDAYLNWPPLFPLALRVAMTVVGDVPLHLHLLMAALATATAVLLGLLARRAMGLTAGVVTGAGFLLLPITLKYGSAVLHIHLAIFLAVAALGAGLEWQRAWIAQRPRAGLWLLAAAALLFLAVATSWEPLLLLPGILVAAWQPPKRVPAVLSHAAGALLGFAAVVALYAWQAPWALAQLQARMWMRAGLADYAVAKVRVHGLAEFVDSGLQAVSLSRLGAAIWRDAALLGPVAVAVMLTFGAWLARGPTTPQRTALRWLALPLLGMVALWLLLMRQHFIVHEYETLTAAPFAALALGWAAHHLAQRPRWAGAWVLLAGSLGVVLAAWHTPLHEEGAYERSMIDAATLVTQHVPQGDLLLTPEDSMVLVYYADRHVIRGVKDDATLASHSADFAALCADCQHFLAVPVASAAAFAGTAATAAFIAENDDFRLYRLVRASAK